jgi:excisionase family DNA binding protein
MEKDQITVAEYLQRQDERLSNIETLLLSQKTVLNFDEVAVYTGLSKSHLYKLTSTGGIPCYKPNGKHIYFDREQINKWLLQNKKKSNAEIDNESSTYVTLNRG